MADRADMEKRNRKVVYLLGAGFSAPLGLPVMSNWTAMSQNMLYTTNKEDSPASQQPTTTDHKEMQDFRKLFNNVTERVKHLAISKNYYNSDLFNMEDLLSLLTMRSALKVKEDEQDSPKKPQGKPKKPNDSELYKDYIKAVIRHYTPDIKPFYAKNQVKLPSNWPYHLFGVNPDWNRYGLFFGALLNLKFSLENSTVPTVTHRDITIERNPKAITDYAIVTLNYDMVPEMPIEYLTTHYPNREGNINFIKTKKEWDGWQGRKASGGTDNKIPLAKIHGDISTEIVPPTWSKPVSPAWQLAADILRDATDLRILGYSLPITDAYIKYLLRAVIADSQLQNIHVICKDSTGDVKRRYDDFICYRDYKFVNGDIRHYLSVHMERYDAERIVKTENELPLDQLEQAHSEFMLAYRQKRR